MSKLYFDIILEDVLLKILSKLKDLDYVKTSSFKILKLLQNDKTCALMLQMEEAPYYRFAVTFKGADGCAIWKDIFLSYKGYRIDNEQYVLKLRFAYLISVDYPHIFKYLKDINFDHYGTYPQGTLGWKRLYSLMLGYGNDNYIKGQFTEKNMKILIGKVKSSGFDADFIDIILFINHFAVGDTNYTDLLDLLHNLFFEYTDMYEMVISTIDINALLKSTDAKNFTEMLKLYGDESNVMFIDDLESRI